MLETPLFIFLLEKSFPAWLVKIKEALLRIPREARTVRYEFMNSQRGIFMKEGDKNIEKGR